MLYHPLPTSYSWRVRKKDLEYNKMTEVHVQVDCGSVLLQPAAMIT